MHTKALIFFLLYPVIIKANPFLNINSLSENKKKHYLTFQVARGFRHAKLVHEFGNMNSYIDSASNRRALNFSIGYLYNLSNYFSVGIDFLVIYSTYSYHTYTEPDSPNSDYRHGSGLYGWGAGLLFPANLSYYYNINKKLNLFLQAGFTIGAAVNTFRKDTFYHYTRLLSPTDSTFTVSAGVSADAKNNLHQYPSLYLYLGTGLEYNVRKNNYLRFYITVSSLIRKNYFTSDHRYYHIDVRNNEVIGIDRVYRKGREIVFGIGYVKELKWSKKK